MANTPEGKIQLAIMQHLKKQGYLFWRNSPNSYDPKLGIYKSNPYILKGLPDIVLLHPGDTKAYPHPVCIGLEVKTNKGKASADQLLMQRRFGLANHEYHVVRSVDDVKALGL